MSATKRDDSTSPLPPGGAKTNVGVLGATGAVGQKFIRLLANHPWFTIKAVAASERSKGKAYSEAAHWIETSGIPESVAGMEVRGCTPEELHDVDFVFSGMDAAVAGPIEQSFAEAGIPVVTNARNYRRDPHVPLLVPEVNPDHITQIEKQRFHPEGKGFIVTNPNCVCVPLSLSLKPLIDRFGVSSVMVTSMQAVSGAGYPGVASLDIMGNVLPYISGEEEKVMWEPQKVLGKLQDDGTVALAGLEIHSSAYRVPLVEGHLLSVVVKLAQEGVSEEEANAAYREWENPLTALDLPSSPEHPVKLLENPFHPQPRLHVQEAGGMQVSVGRMRKAGVFDMAYTALGHNTIRGAAGGAVLNAELLCRKGYLGR